MIVHAIQCQADCIVVSAHDTDVLVLLLAHYEKINCHSLWMKSGTARKQQFIPVHTIHQNLSKGMVDTVIPFHALTGCDSTSFFAGHSKKSEWKIFENQHGLLNGMNHPTLTLEGEMTAVNFVCRIYGLSDVESTNSARVILFKKGRPAEALPPTNDALHYHILRAHYQSLVWNQAHVLKPVLPAPDDCGWQTGDGRLRPKLMSLTPVPVACIEVISCGCKTGCRTSRCKCRKATLTCTGACSCTDGLEQCMNNA